VSTIDSTIPLISIGSSFSNKANFKYVALDRDDTLIQDSGYTDLTHQPVWLPGVLSGLELLSAKGYGLVVLTNQAALSKGIYKIEKLDLFHKLMNLSLKKHLGINFDAFIVCPHLATDLCGCRKPASGMFDAAFKIYGVLPDAMFGNSDSDVQAANAAGVAGIKVENGNFFECVLGWLDKK
jgi:D-glycero-D-manno-heptose 1,7-bisphosphate phosphatase